MNAIINQCLSCSPSTSLYYLLGVYTSWKYPTFLLYAKMVGPNSFFPSLKWQLHNLSLLLYSLSARLKNELSIIFLFVLNINKTIFWIQYNTEGMWYWKLELVLFWGESKRSRITWHYCIGGKLWEGVFNLNIAR